MTRLTRSFAALLVSSVALSASAAAQSGTVSVGATQSLYLAGGNAYSAVPGCGAPGCVPPDGGGIAPVSIALTSGTGRVLTFSSVLGTMSFCPGNTCVTSNPDGPAPPLISTGLNSSGAISGISAGTAGFLGGVFLGAGLPASAPASLDFNTIGTEFLSLNPVLGQLFFIGDGSTAASVTQQFFVPDGATTLYLGIADGFSFWGDPGAYDDNEGAYRASYTVQSTVPEPSTFLLMAVGAVAVFALRRRRA